MQFFRTPNIDFVGNRKKAMIASIVLLLIGIGSFTIRGGFRTSIDFSGGALVEVRIPETSVELADIREIVSNAGFDGAEVTNFGSSTEYLIKVKSVGNAEEVAEQVKVALRDGLASRIDISSADAIEMRRTESVGPKVGAELRTATLWAILWSLLGIVVYVSWRFEFRFAIAALVALIHDILFTLGFFSITNLEVSLAVIAAILTIVGYSLNDTIVVFDRIRENMHNRKRENYEVLVNTSVNETLSRTVVTSVTTLLVVLALVIFGGEVIKDFAVTLLVGVLVGTYSSVFVASPVLVEWQIRRAAKQKK
jgi:preprotein translocase subunit SecF